MLSSYEWQHISSFMRYHDAIKILHLNHTIRQTMCSGPVHSLQQILLDHDVLGALCLFHQPDLTFRMGQECKDQGLCAYVLQSLIDHHLNPRDREMRIIINIYSEMNPVLPIVATYNEQSSTLVQCDLIRREQVDLIDPFTYNYTSVLLNTLMQGKWENFWSIFNQFDHLSLHYPTPHPDNIHRAFGMKAYLTLLERSYQMVSHRPDVTRLINLLQMVIKECQPDLLLHDQYFNIIKCVYKHTPIKKFLMACLKKRLDYVVSNIVAMPQQFMMHGFRFSSLTHVFPNLLALIRPQLTKQDYYYMLCHTYEKLPHHTFTNLDSGRQQARNILSQLEEIVDDTLPESVIEIHYSQHSIHEYIVVQPLIFILFDEAIRADHPLLSQILTFIQDNSQDDQILQACVYYHLSEVFIRLQRNVPSHSLFKSMIDRDFQQARNLILVASQELKESQLISVWDIVNYMRELGVSHPPFSFEVIDGLPYPLL